MEITIRTDAAVVKFADRRSKEPMSTTPSVNKSTVLILKNEKLIKFDSPTSFSQKITFDISRLDESGLYGPPDGKRALSYEFCIPDTVQHRTEVKRIDQTVKFFAQSPGRIGCGESENLCIGSTHQEDFRGVLQRLAELTYVQRIDESFFE